VQRASTDTKQNDISHETSMLHISHTPFLLDAASGRQATWRVGVSANACLRCARACVYIYMNMLAVHRRTSVNESESGTVVIFLIFLSLLYILDQGICNHASIHIHAYTHPHARTSTQVNRRTSIVHLLPALSTHVCNFSIQAPSQSVGHRSGCTGPALATTPC